MIEQFYDLKPQVLELDRKTLELCRDQFAHLEEIRDYNPTENAARLYGLRRGSPAFPWLHRLRRVGR